MEIIIYSDTDECFEFRCQKLLNKSRKKKKSTYVNHHYFILSYLDIQYSFSYYARQNLANTALLIELFTNLILFLSTGMESSILSAIRTSNWNGNLLINHTQECFKT